MSRKILGIPVSSLVRKILPILLISSLLLAALPQSAFSAVDETCQATYVVKSGDYLAKIADAYDVTWLAIASANDLKSPYVVFVGQKLCIPAKSSSGSTGGTGSSSSSKTPKVSAVLSGNKLDLSASNLPTNSFYFVKVDDAAKVGLVWYRIGVVSTGKDDAATRSFTLPDDVKNAKSLNVCLKNIVTDAVACNNPLLTRNSSSSDSDSGSSGKVGSISVTGTTKQLNVTALNFPANSFFTVKVRETGKITLDWYKVGEIKTTGAKSSAVYTFSIPSQLEKVSHLDVCVKNQVTDVALCSSIVH